MRDIYKLANIEVIKGNTLNKKIKSEKHIKMVIKYLPYIAFEKSDSIMDTIFDTLVAACREIIADETSQQEIAEMEDKKPVQQSVQSSVDEKLENGEQVGAEQEVWLQFQNAIVNHIKVNNSKKTDPIILIEQSSEQQQPYSSTPQSAIDNKDSEQTQGEGEVKEINLQNKPPIKIVCKKAEVKAPLLMKGKTVAQTKKISSLSRREQMNRELRVKVNIEELKERIIQPGKPILLTEQKKEQKPQNPTPPLPPPSSKKQLKPIESEDISFNDLRNIQYFGNKYPFEEPLQVSKGKVAKKGGKNERPQRQQQLQRPTAVSVPAFGPSERHIVERRAAPGQIDLGVMCLDEVVGYCREKQLISEQFFMEYMASSDDSNITHFINLFIQNKYKQQWNFRRYKVTIMDHRRLAEYLVRIFPQQFKICMPDSNNPSIKDFLENLYSLSQSKYKQLLESFDADSKVNQWKIMKAKLQKYDKIPVRVLPAPQFAQTYKKPSSNDFSMKPTAPIMKKSFAPKLEPQKNNRKRTLNSMYSDPYREQVDEHESRLASLKNQLRKKKAS